MWNDINNNLTNVQIIRLNHTVISKFSLNKIESTDKLTDSWWMPDKIRSEKFTWAFGQSDLKIKIYLNLNNKIYTSFICKDSNRSACLPNDTSFIFLPLWSPRRYMHFLPALFLFLNVFCCSFGVKDFTILALIFQLCK